MGVTVIFRGAVSVITNAPETIDASVPRFTAKLIGPIGAFVATETFICALVEAAEEMLPPKVGEPRTMPELDVVKATPEVMSSPPVVSVPATPRATRIPKAGLVRFRPVLLFGSVSMSAVEMAPALKAIGGASVCVETFPKYVVPKSVLVLA
jgi:hypothetical protein